MVPLGREPYGDACRLLSRRSYVASRHSRGSGVRKCIADPCRSAVTREGHRSAICFGPVRSRLTRTQVCPPLQLWPRRFANRMPLPLWQKTALFRIYGSSNGQPVVSASGFRQRKRGSKSLTSDDLSHSGQLVVRPAKKLATVARSPAQRLSPTPDPRASIESGVPDASVGTRKWQLDRHLKCQQNRSIARRQLVLPVVLPHL
jgi:hypothetical protein